MRIFTRMKRTRVSELAVLIKFGSYSELLSR